MNKINEKAIFVIANYRFMDANQFCNELESSESFKKNNNDFEKIKIESNIPLPKNFPMPLAVYRNKNTQLMYSVGDARLDISSINYFDNKEKLKNLLSTLAQFKLQEISAIGINYDADCEIDKRLCIFNKNIDDTSFTNWSKNLGFKIELPLNLESLYDCIATYSIKKVQGETSTEGEIVEPYIYNISVNYNFTINEDKADTMKRFEKLNLIINRIDDLYTDFERKCREITNL